MNMVLSDVIETITVVEPAANPEDKPIIRVGRLTLIFFLVLVYDYRC
jgi:small nuclear ribonucleoprotein (snRNP)-like protein